MKQRSQVLAYSGTFLALVAAGSWISLPFVPVPLTLQTLFVLLSGVFMKRSAAVPIALYVLLGAAGLPIFHNGTAGIGVLLGPTGGYLIGFIPAASIAGLAYERRSERGRIAGLVLAAGVIHLFGVAWLAYSASLPLPQAILLGAVPFIPGDAVKVAAAYAIGKRIQ